MRRTFRQLWSRRSLYLLTFLAIVMSVGFVNATLTLTDSVGAGDATTVRNAESGIDAVVDADPGARPRGFSGPSELMLTGMGVPTDVVGAVGSDPGVRAAEAVWRTNGSLIAPDGSIVGQTRGPFNEVETWVTDDTIARWHMSEGRAPAAPGEMVLDTATARRFGVAIGDEYRLSTDRSSVRLRVVGLARYGTADSRPSRTTVLVDATEPAIVGARDTATQVLVGGASGVSSEQLLAGLHADLERAGYPGRVRSGDQAADDEVARVAVETTILSRLLTVFTIVAALTGMLIITNTFAITIVQRRRELALMRVVGNTRASLVRHVLLEAGALGVVATVVGLLLGRGTVVVIRALFDRAGVEAFDGPLQPTAGTLAITVFVGVLITVLAALRAAVAGSRVPPAAALRDATVDHSGAPSRRAVAGPLLAATGAAITAVGIVVGRAPAMAVGALTAVVGIYLSGPLLAALTARVARPLLTAVGGATGRISARNAARSPRRVSAAAAGLMIGIAVVAFFSTLAYTVKSLQVGPVSAIRADHVVTPLGAPAGKVPGELTSELRALPGVKDVAAVHATVGLAVDPPGASPARPTAMPVGMVEADSLDATYDLRPDGVDAAHLEPGQVVVASSELSRHPIGSSVTVRGAAGAATATVVGSFATPLPGFASPRLLFDEQTYDSVFGDPGTVALFLSTDGTPATLGDVASLANGSGRLQTAGEYASASTSPVDTILGLIYALLVIAVVIALVGLANTMALSIRERTGEIGVARAIGTTRLQVVASVLLEGSITAILGVSMGLVVGIGATFPTVALLDNAALSSPLVPIERMAVIAIVGVVAGVLATIPPAVAASRRPPLDAIAAP